MLSLRYILCGLTMPLLLSVGPQASAQAPSTGVREKNLATGISIGRVRDDPTIGLELLSPTLLTKYLRAHVKLNRTWLEAYKAASDHAAAYTTTYVGLTFTRRLSDQARATAEAGSFVASGNVKFSKRRLWPGYYVACGVELYSLAVEQRHLAFVLSAGYASTRARAGKLEGRPSYADGVFFRMGLRYYF